jgi:hypothetical protein
LDAMPRKYMLNLSPFFNNILFQGWSKEGRRKEMKKIFMFFSVCFMIILSSCGGGPMYHPNKSAADFEREKSICRQYALENEQNTGLMGNPFVIRDGMRE